MESDKELKILIQKEEDCFKTCSDYSCVRSGGCTGSAGHAVSDVYRKKKEQEENKKEAERIRKLLKDY